MPGIGRAQAGQVMFVSGDVRITDGAGRTRALVKGAAVNAGEMLQSAASSTAQLRMSDGALIALRPDTQLRIDAYVYNGREDGKENALVSLLRGGFRTITGVIGRTNKDRYRIQTPVATIGIRGTDHEPHYIPPAGPGERQIAPPGAYDKVNVGAAYIATARGSVDIQANQVGFAAPNIVPQVLPRIPEFFRATPPPSAAAARQAQGESARPAAQRERVGSDSAAAQRQAEAAPAPVSRPDPLPVVTVAATSSTTGTLDFSAQTVTNSSGTTATLTPGGATVVRGSGTVAAVVSSSSNSGGQATADALSVTQAVLLRDAATNAPYSFSETWDISTWGYDIVGATPLAPAVSTNSVGIQYGAWSGGLMSQRSSFPIADRFSNENFAYLPRWTYGVQGYLDLGITAGPIGNLTGVYTYRFDAATAPVDRVSGLTGTVNTATTSFGADFTALTWSANVDLAVGGQQWLASAANQPMNSPSAFASPGGAGNTLTVSKVGCSTCFTGGDLYWGFTGRNVQGVLVGYNLYEVPSTTSKLYTADISGSIAFTRNGVTTNPVFPIGTVGTPTGKYLLFDSTLRTLVLADTVSTDATGMLTGYAATFSTGQTLARSTVGGTTGSAIPSPDGANTGIALGTWDAGALTHVLATPLGTSQFHWAVGPDAFPLHLPQVLTGTLTYTLDGFTNPTNQAGIAGTLNSASLLLDFGKQTADVSLNAAVNAHTWAATASGMRLEDRQFSSNNAITPLSVTVDGTASGFGNIAGNLTGTGLNGAAVSYALSAPVGGGFESINGVAAFSAPAQDTAAPYRLIAEAGHSLGDLSAPRDMINGEFVAASRVGVDAAGNLTGFDSTASSAGSGHLSVAVAPGSATLLDLGRDPITGVSWGRWAGGSINVTDRATGALTALANPGSLHWIAGPQMTGPVALPISGTYAYTHVGGTLPTNSAGTTGAVNSAALTANFSAMTVDASVSTAVAGTTLNGTATGMKIHPQAYFTSNVSGGGMTVTCAGTCGTSHGGNITGAFSGPTGEGAAVLYFLGTMGATGPVATSAGVAAFRR